MIFNIFVSRIEFYSISVLFIISFLSVTFDDVSYTHAQTSETVHDCSNIGGLWDEEHKICLNIHDSLKCELIGGTYLTGVGSEYVCPLDNPECGGFMGAPSVCVFPNSIKTEVEQKTAGVEKNTHSNIENTLEDQNNKEYLVVSEDDAVTYLIIIILVCVICSVVGIFYIKSRKK